MGLILGATGLIAAAVEVFLFYALREPLHRSNTFAFTTWYCAFQIVMLFGALLYAAIRDGHPGSIVPVNSAVVTIVFACNVLAVVTVVIFNLILPQYSTPRTYYSVSLAETALGIATVILIQAAGVAHQVGHMQAVATREAVQELASTCDRIATAATVHGWSLDSAADDIRFSEGVRRNPALAEEVSRRLMKLEALAGATADDSVRAEADKIVNEIKVLAARRG
jgi:hypothetical protein